MWYLMACKLRRILIHCWCCSIMLGSSETWTTSKSFLGLNAFIFVSKKNFYCRHCTLSAFGNSTQGGCLNKRVFYVVTLSAAFQKKKNKKIKWNKSETWVHIHILKWNFLALPACNDIMQQKIFDVCVHVHCQLLISFLAAFLFSFLRKNRVIRSWHHANRKKNDRRLCKRYTNRKQKVTNLPKNINQISLLTLQFSIQ